jgi:hypothetical protein
MVFASDHLLIIRNCNIDVYPMEALRGLAKEVSGTIVTVHAIQTIIFPIALWKAVVYDISPTDQDSVVFLGRYETTALLKYTLRYSMTEGNYSFVLNHEETYFTNTPESSPWIANLCIGTTGQRALWVAGSRKTEKDTLLLGCSLDRHTVNEDHAQVESVDSDAVGRDDFNLWDSHYKHHPDLVPDVRVLWKLPGDDEYFWDMCRQLAFDDAMGIAVLGTAQGHIWVLDYA